MKRCHRMWFCPVLTRMNECGGPATSVAVYPIPDRAICFASFSSFSSRNQILDNSRYVSANFSIWIMTASFCYKSQIIEHGGAEGRDPTPALLMQPEQYGIPSSPKVLICFCI